MFGTSRIVKDIMLDIRALDDQTRQEVCQAWGIVSYTSEIDFQTEKEDDVLGFNLFVKKETLLQYIDLIKAGAISDIHFCVGRVSGFYSEWSPGISTRSVKILTSYQDHAYENPDGVGLQAPRLGVVGEAALHFTRRMIFRKPDTETPDDTIAIAPIATPMDLEKPSKTLLIDPEIKASFKSLKTIGWWITAFLAFIAIRGIWS